MKHLHGLSYLAYLLRHPYQEFHVLALVSVSRNSPDRSTQSPVTLAESGLHVSRLGDAGEVLDAQAKAAYKQRLEELQETLREAQAFNDLERAGKAQEEIDLLTQQLVQAVGLGGRHRKAASSAERARVNVTKRIKTALAKIAEHSPQLAVYLTKTIKTGFFCSFTPDPRVPVTWQF